MRKDLTGMPWFSKEPFFSGLPPTRNASPAFPQQGAPEGAL